MDRLRTQESRLKTGGTGIPACGFVLRLASCVLCLPVSCIFFCCLCGISPTAFAETASESFFFLALGDPRSESFSFPALGEPRSDYLTIAEMVRAVSVENLRDIVTDLQENRDIDLPHKLYNSRYCLRVKDTDDPSDGACDNASNYIFSKFASYGLNVEYDPFIHEVKDQGRYRMRNVVATLPGKGPGSDKVYIVCSHYDSIAGLQTGWMWDWKILPAPGADDNASGTAAVLETARILSDYDFNFTIKFITFSGEELGMFGSKHYVSEILALGDPTIAGVINLDMVAYDPDELDIDIVANEDSEWLANAIHRSGELYNIDLVVNRTVDPEKIYSDHSPFWRSGYSAVLMTEGSDPHSDEFSPVNHTPDDTIDRLNFELATRVARLAVATLAQLADPITAPDDVVNPDLLVEADSVRFSHVPSSLTDSVTVTYSVRNLGPEDVEDVSVQVWLVPPAVGAGFKPAHRDIGDFPHIVQEQILALRANTSRELSASLTLDQWGDYQVLIKVNHDSRILESDFSNNLARKTVFISTELGVAELTAYPNPAEFSEKEVKLRYKLSRDANVTMEIRDIRGGLVYREEFAPGENGGRRGPDNNVRWNGTNQDLNPVAAGVYICRIVATNATGETRSALKKLAVLR